MYHLSYIYHIWIFHINVSLLNTEYNVSILLAWQIEIIIPKKCLQHCCFYLLYNFSSNAKVTETEHCLIF